MDGACRSTAFPRPFLSLAPRGEREPRASSKDMTGDKGWKFPTWWAHPGWRKLFGRWPSRTTRRSGTSPRRPSRRARNAGHRGELLLHPEARGLAAPLRLPPGVGRRPPELGGAEGAVLRPARQAARDARRGPPGRLRLLRRGHPGGGIRGGTVVLWDRGTWTPAIDPGIGTQEGRAEVPPPRGEAHRQVGPRPDQGGRPQGLAPRQGQGRALPAGGRDGHRERAPGERRLGARPGRGGGGDGTVSGTRRSVGPGGEVEPAGPPRETGARPPPRGPRGRGAGAAAPDPAAGPRDDRRVTAGRRRLAPRDQARRLSHRGANRRGGGTSHLPQRKGLDEGVPAGGSCRRPPAGGTALLDGEVAAVLPNGATSFQALQKRAEGADAARLLRLRPPAPRRLGPA